MQVGNRVRKIDDQRGGVPVGTEGAIVSVSPDEAFFVAFDGREYGDADDGESGEHCISWEIELIDDPAPAEPEICLRSDNGEIPCGPPRDSMPVETALEAMGAPAPPEGTVLRVHNTIQFRYGARVSWFRKDPSPGAGGGCIVHGKVQGTVSDNQDKLFVVASDGRSDRVLMQNLTLLDDDDDPIIPPPAVLTSLPDDEREALRTAAIEGDPKARGVLEGVALSFMERAGIGIDGKDSNPKDAVGIAKAYASTIPRQVLWEVGLAMLEGSLKYGRHNYRKAGVRASVYYDACTRHMDQWWEGEDLDPDSGLSHITKAIAGLIVLRDAMMNGLWADDRPPRNKNAGWMTEMNARAKALLDKYPPEARKAPFTQADHGAAGE